MIIKNNCYILLIILSIFAFASISTCGQTPQTQRRMPETKLPDVRFPAGKNVVEVPFEAEGNHIVIPLSVNGSRPLRFVFDTGAPFAVLNNSAVVDSLNLKITGARQARGAGGGGATFEVKVAENVNFNVGGLELSNGNMSVLPRSSRGHDGVIGSPLFATTVVEIDWEKKVVRFYEPSKYKYSGSGTVLPLTFDEGGRPYTTASVTVAGEKAIPVKLIVDTGGDHSLILEPVAGSEIKLPEGATKTSLGRGASGEITGYMGRLKSFQLGSYTVKDVPTGFPDASSGTAGLNGRDGNLGSGVLRRFKVIYDYSRKQMIVEPNKFINEPFGTTMPNNLAANTAQVSPAALQDYTGRYGERAITSEGGALYIQRPGGPKLKLVAVAAKDEFTLEAVPAARIKFIRDDAGKITEIQILNREGQWENIKKEQSKNEPLSGNQPNNQSEQSLKQSAVDAQTKEQLKTTMAYLLEDIYVIPEKGQEIAKQLRAKFESDAYKDAATPTELAQMLARDLRAIGKDKHLNMRYDGTEASESQTILTPQEWDKQKSSVFPKRTTAPQLNVSSQLNARLAEQLRQTNYEFREAKYLDGNIGYINMAGFAPGREARDAAAKAMAAVANSDAMIIDLRQCPGGTSEMVNYLASYFFDKEPRLLMSRYIRPTGETVESKTVADLPGKRMLDTDLYILVSSKTGSACESFPYILQQFGRAKIVGETTTGAGYNNVFIPVGKGYSFSVSYGRPTHPVSGRGWEAVGVQPDIAVKPEMALETAQKEALQKLINKTTDEKRKKELMTALQNVGRNSTAQIVAASLISPNSGNLQSSLQDYVGRYGERIISAEDGALYIQRQDGPKIKMVAAAKDEFTLESVPAARIKFVRDEAGKMTEIQVLNREGKWEKSKKETDNQPTVQPQTEQKLSKAEQEVRRVEREWLDAYEKHDADAMNRVVADDFMITYPDGRSQTKADILKHLQSPPDAARPTPKFFTDNTTSQVFGDTVILTGRVTQQTERDGQIRKMESRYTDVYVKRNGRWQVVASQLSPIMPMQQRPQSQP